MPLLQRTDSIAANAFNANVWTGTQFEFAPYNALLEASIMGSATGLQVTLATGADVLAIDQAVTPVRAANQYGIYPDDYVFQDIVGAGERIVEAIRNTTAGALSHFSSIKLTPVGG
jgi:hypothetical protein